MVNMALEDSLVRDLLEDAVDPAQHGGLAGSAARLEAATPVISVVSPLASLLARADMMCRHEHSRQTTLPSRVHAVPLAVFEELTVSGVWDLACQGLQNNKELSQSFTCRLHSPHHRPPRESVRACSAA